jgi:hypothetical protein
MNADKTTLQEFKINVKLLLAALWAVLMFIWTHLVVACMYVVVGIGNVIGETWAFYILGSVVEFVLLMLIFWYAWTWPRQEKGL